MSCLCLGLCKAVAPLKSLSRDPLKLTLSRYSSQAHTLQLSFLSNASPALSLALSSQAHSLPLFLSLVKMAKDI
ncbi:hypothetical protein Bca52824_056818 [Brassica carinata]|uniref:Uncharacterized protein n=1 Tax=Brassica carinata TaxID=52824 RepID=A0A8X7QV10_BRACI|nr:hypothetical protein Bca52824_056818 [Brassica carinata]